MGLFLCAVFAVRLIGLMMWSFGCCLACLCAFHCFFVLSWLWDCLFVVVFIVVCLWFVLKVRGPRRSAVFLSHLELTTIKATMLCKRFLGGIKWDNCLSASWADVWARAAHSWPRDIDWDNRLGSLCAVSRLPNIIINIDITIIILIDTRNIHERWRMHIWTETADGCTTDIWNDGCWTGLMQFFFRCLLRLLQQSDTVAL